MLAHRLCTCMCIYLCFESGDILNQTMYMYMNVHVCLLQQELEGGETGYVKATSASWT